jgi:hypothetical protein
MDKNDLLDHSMTRPRFWDLAALHAFEKGLAPKDAARMADVLLAERDSRTKELLLSGRVIGVTASEEPISVKEALMRVLSRLGGDDYVPSNTSIQDIEDEIIATVSFLEDRARMVVGTGDDDDD